jgi:hypothetical protein
MHGRNTDKKVAPWLLLLGSVVRMWSRGRAHRQGLALCKPAEIRFLTFAQAYNRFEQNREGRSSPKATGLPER